MYYYQIVVFILFVLCVCMKFVDSTCDRLCQEECLVFHNKYRLNHNVSTLVYDHNLAKQAQMWADSRVLDTSSWGKTGSGGECWAWGNIFPSWKAVIKTWHDQEKHYDWEQHKSKNNQKIGCFQQIVWAGATKLGCGVGVVNNLPFYVAQMDVAGVIDPNVIGHAEKNIRKPFQHDTDWFNGDLDLLPEVLRDTKYVPTTKQF